MLGVSIDPQEAPGPNFFLEVDFDGEGETFKLSIPDQNQVDQGQHKKWERVSSASILMSQVTNHTETWGLQNRRESHLDICRSQHSHLQR